MNFAVPWMLAGLAGLGVPLWLHLQRRKKTQPRVFAALRFVDESPVVRHAPRRLRDPLLWVLRSLGFAAVVFAFARPNPDAPTAPAGLVSRVYVLDSTFSTRAGGGWIRDRDWLIRELEGLGENVQAGVVELRGRPRVLVGLGESPQTAIERLQSLEPSHERGSYLAAFRQASSVLERSLGSRREIVFLGDGQLNQWEENPNVPGFLRGVEVRFAHLPEQAQRENWSVGGLEFRRVFLGDSVQVQCAGILRHSGPAGRAELVVESGGREVLRRMVPVQSGQSEVPVGALWRQESDGWVEGRIRLEGIKDALGGDEAGYFAGEPVEEGRVAVLTGNTFLRGALKPEVARGYWRLDEWDPADLGRVEKDPGEVLVVEAHYLQSLAVQKAVEKHLEVGSGVWILMDRVGPVAREALMRWGVGFGPLDRVSDSGTGIGRVALGHQVFAPFASPDFGDLSRVRVAGFSDLSGGSGNGLAWSEGGYPLVVEVGQRKGAGRLVVSAFGMDRRQTNWGVLPSFVPVVDLMLQYLRPQSQRVSWLDCGVPWRIQLQPWEKAGSVVVRRDGREMCRVPVDERGQAEVRLPDAPGIYKLSFGDSEKTERVAVVNLRAEESDLRYERAEPAAVGRWRVPEPDRVEISRQAQPVRKGALWWWWLLLMGAMVLVAESIWTVAVGWNRGSRAKKTGNPIVFGK
ncbi:MAG: hypothetical protein RLZZ253_434 [Verrucomicrobiota bacterium]|jgi:hypothetical protein